MKRSLSQSEQPSIYEDSRAYLESTGRPKDDDADAREKCKEIRIELEKNLELVEQLPSQHLDSVIDKILKRDKYLKYLLSVANGHESRIARGRSFYGATIYEALLVQAHEYGGLSLGKLVIMSITPRKCLLLRCSIDIILQHIREIGQILSRIKVQQSAPNPQTFLNRLLQESQKRWASSGEVIEETIKDIGLSEDALEWVAETKKSVEHGRQPQGLEGIGNVDSLRLLCWMIPQEAAWESEALDITRDLGPVVVRIACQCNQSDLLDRDKCAVIETLAAIIKAKSSVAEALDIATGILNDRKLPRYLHGLIALQKSTLYRLQAEPKKSEEEISQYFQDTETHDNETRARIASLLPDAPGDEIDRLCRQGRERRQAAVETSLWRSHLENLIQQEEYLIALNEAETWKFIKPSCQMERLLLPHISITTAKIFQTLGEFHRARRCLEDTLFGAAMVGEQMNTTRSNILCRLADILCELGEPSKAFKLLQPEYEKHVGQCRSYRKIQRLLLSFVDAYLSAECYQDALIALCDSRLNFQKLDKNNTDQFLHVRCQFSRARLYFYINRFEDSCREWDAALALVKTYPDFKDDGFAAGICHLSLAWAYAKRGNQKLGYEAYEQAKCYLEKSPPNYWLPTIQTSWFPQASLQLSINPGWPQVRLLPRPTPPDTSCHTPPTRHRS